jgi:predicted RNA-binding Zn-ribbon protein involved in translation (DUF1610 family)
MNLVSYICPNCGHRTVIGLEVVVGESPKHKCPQCGTEMKKE